MGRCGDGMFNYLRILWCLNNFSALFPLALLFTAFQVTADIHAPLLVLPDNTQVRSRMAVTSRCVFVTKERIHMLETVAMNPECVLLLTGNYWYVGE